MYFIDIGNGLLRKWVSRACSNVLSPWASLMGYQGALSLPTWAINTHFSTGLWWYKTSRFWMSVW